MRNLLWFNKRRTYLYLVLLIPMYCLSQPYIFRTVTLPNDFVQIQKVDLSTGTKSLFVPDTLYPYTSVVTDHSNTWVYASRGNRDYEFTLYKIDNPTIKKIFRNDLAENNDFEYYPQVNKLVVDWIGDRVPGRGIEVYDGTTLSLLDTILFLPRVLYYGALSDDASTYLETYTDTLNGIEYDQVYSTASRTLIRQRNLATIGHPTEKHTIDLMKGRYLYGYQYPPPPPHDSKNGYELVYDPRLDSVLAIMARPFISKSKLSADGKYVIIQETPLNPDSSPLVDAHIKTGKIWIYNANNGNLISKLNLSDNGDIYVFDNYPNMLYYYLPSEQRSINIDLSKLTPPSGCNVKLVNSTGTKLTGGALQYYEGSWKDATNNNDGTFTVTTTAKTLSLRMTYEYGTQTKSNVTVGYDTIVFQTINAQIQLQNSNGVLIDTGSVQYYAGAWRTLGTTINGTAVKELLPANYSFRMTYAYASKDKQQDIGTNATVVFQTVKATVQLQNSLGNLIDQGTVQYYSGAWRDFGTTLNGITTMELLPNNYSFRMTYAYASKDKQQDISTNPTVVFQTVNAAIQLQNSQGSLIDQGTVQYYSGAWRDLGTTTNGVAKKELLPNNYSFRITYEYVSLDKAQDITTNNTVSFSTVLCTIRVKNSQNQLVNNAMASYYSSAWRQIGNTVNGVITKELLPVNLSFRVKYGTQQQDKQQNLLTNNVVEFGIQ